MANKHLSLNIEVETKLRLGNKKWTLCVPGCGKKMGEKDGKGIRGISHSLCQECLADLMAKVESKSITRDKQNVQ